MSVSLQAAGIRVVLLDIEGTTTPIAFVHDVLFPFARARVRSYLDSHLASDRELLDAANELREEHARDVASGQLPATSFPLPAGNGPISEGGHEPEGGSWHLGAIVRYVHWLMDRDRKSHGLKLLQGRIWERGYTSGELKGEVYPDVRPALERWTTAGVGVGIFSSGSVLAQKLLFANSIDGDLRPFLRWHFDTAVGPKIDPDSYRRIVEAIEVPAARALFVSDVVQELDAARAAGLQTLLAVRTPAIPPGTSGHRIVREFLDIVV